MSKLPFYARPIAEQVALLDPDEFAIYLDQEASRTGEADEWSRALATERSLREARAARWPPA